MTKKRTPKQACRAAISAIGGPAKVAALFPPMTSQAVSQWDVIPKLRVLTVVQAAQKAGSDITLHEACPSLYAPTHTVASR